MVQNDTKDFTMLAKTLIVWDLTPLVMRCQQKKLNFNSTYYSGEGQEHDIVNVQDFSAKSSL